MTQQPKYILTALGEADGPALPKLELNIWCVADGSAKDMACTVAKGLHAAGYTSFTLYRTTDGVPKVGTVAVEMAPTARFVEGKE